MPVITFQEITADTWYEVGHLRVFANQADWIVPNFQSLVEAAYGFSGGLAPLKIVPLAIYADDAIVGFTMYNTTPQRDRFFIMRMMIDYRYQGNGYGIAAVRLLLNLFRVHPQAKEAATTYVRGNEAAQHVYSTCGFQDLGLQNNHEFLMWQPLNPQSQPWTSFWNGAWRGA